MTGRQTSSARQMLEEARSYYISQNRDAHWGDDKEGKEHLKLQLYWHGYLIWARLYPADGQVILVDEWGQSQSMQVSESTLQVIKSWTQGES